MAARCDPQRSAGGIEAVVAELVPRLAALKPDWDVSAIYAFPAPRGWNKIPLLCDIVAGFRLWRQARGTDAVIVNGAEYLWMMALDPAFRTKTVIVWHGTRAFEIPALTPDMSLPVRIYWLAERWLQSLAFHFQRHIVVAPSVLEEIRRAYKRVLKAEVVTNGAPAVPLGAGDPRPADDAFVVVWSGTNAYKKGLDVALAACREARATLTNLELHVFGLPRDADADAPWIRWHGIAPRPLALAAVAQADAYLATTRYEACSMAVLEALALGTPIVGSPAISWMLEDVGTAVPDYAPRSFADALGRVRAHAPARTELVTRARPTLARFDWDRAARAYAAIIQDVLQAASKRGRDA